jgi:hypothetical protein
MSAQGALTLPIAFPDTTVVAFCYRVNGSETAYDNEKEQWTKQDPTVHWSKVRCGRT